METNIAWLYLLISLLGLGIIFNGLTIRNLQAQLAELEALVRYHLPKEEPDGGD